MGPSATNDTGVAQRSDVATSHRPWFWRPKPWSRARKFRRSKQHEQNKISMRYFTLDPKNIGTKETSGIRDKAWNLELPKIKFRRCEIQNIKSPKVSECSSIPANHSNAVVYCLSEFYRNFNNFYNKSRISKIGTTKISSWRPHHRGSLSLQRPGNFQRSTQFFMTSFHRTKIVFNESV